MVDVTEVIRNSFAKRGIDPSVGLRIAQIESRLNPRAKNPVSSAGGLFQFIDGTAKDYGLADRFDPVQSSEAAARLTSDNRDLLRGKLGRDPTPGELYLAHQQGGGGALKLLQNPDTPAASLVGTKAVIQNGGNQGMLARDFAALWQAKIDGVKPPVSAGPAPVQPEMPQIAAAQPMAAPQQVEEPSIANVLGSALTQFNADTQKPAPQPAATPFQTPQMAMKKPNLANILAGTSAPLLVGRPAA